MRFIVVAGCAIAMGLAGCTSNGFDPFRKSSDPMVSADDPYAAPAGPGLAASPEQRFAEIPLPMGLTEDKERTYVFESSNLQIGRMVYRTKSATNELAQFYLTECPAKGWKLQQTVEVPDGGTELTFTKPDKRLDIRVRDLGYNRRELTIHLTPTNV